MPEEKKKKTERYTIVEIATETAPALQDSETNETITQVELLRRMSNDLELLKKQLIG